MSLDENIDQLVKEETATSKAVTSLIEINDNKDKTKFGTDVEVKTDLTDSRVCHHSIAKIIGFVLRSNKDSFNNLNIHDLAIDSVERKRLSLDRKSRHEIVEVARNPDMSFNQDHATGGFVRSFFSSKRNKE